MRTDSNRWAHLFLFLAVLFGAIVRFAPTIISGSIINDGGMFFAMIGNLRTNGFLLPSFTTYNNVQIPFVYPPFSLYFGGLLSQAGIPTTDVVRWLPPIVSTASILAFFWMASQMLNSKNKASLAAVAYALMPRSYSWYVMGGGLSRSFGVLFLLLTCASAWTLFSRMDRRPIALTVLFGAGAVVSHPETGLHTAAACALIFLFMGRTRQGIADAAISLAGVMVLTSPWWITALTQHGMAPFLSALATGGHSGLFWLPWLTLNFAEEPFVTILTALGLVGVAVQLIRGDWFLTVWMLTAFVIEPRSATAIAALPLACLAGCALADFIIPNIASLAHNSGTDLSDWTIQFSQSRAARIVLGYIVFSAFLGAYAYDTNLAKYTIPADSRAAMEWIKLHTPQRSSFIVLTGSSDPFADPVAEWFPVLTARTSENTVQGREWLLGKDFMPFLNSLEPLQACLNQEPACVEDWAKSHLATPEYIYLRKGESKNSAQPSNLLSYELRQDPSYTLVFENQGVVIFSRK